MPKHRRLRLSWFLRRCLSSGEGVRRWQLKQVAVPLAALFCTGCIYTVEEVFYAQNHATEALMWALSNPDLAEKDLEKLVKAEEKLIAACHPVNRLATTTLDGKSVTVTEGVEANSAKTSCARQVKKVEKMLWEIDPEVAAAYWKCKGCALKTKVADSESASGG